MNRTQQLVLGFFVLAWVALIAILAAAPEVYEQLLRLPGGEPKLPMLAFLTALSTFLMLLGVGVVRRWRWTFWLVLVAYPSSEEFCECRRLSCNSGGCYPLIFPPGT